MRPCACGLRGATQQAQRASLKGDTDSGQVTARTAALLAALGTGATPRRPLLTPREREVLGLIAEDSGTARSPSASYAASTPSTATSLNILSKLGVPSRAAATARAAADGLL
jgi:ATP/maltotriose-dependent transcriptional regulator MalT